MVYRKNDTIVLLPDFCNSYPPYVIDLLNSYPHSSFVITLDKRILESICPHSYYLERNYKVKGKDNLSIQFILNQIELLKPHLVVLDQCFWDSKSYLLYDIFLIRWHNDFQLVNVLQMRWAKNSNKISRMELAQNIIAPSWKKESLEWVKLINVNIDRKFTYYDKEEMVVYEDYCCK